MRNSTIIDKTVYTISELPPNAIHFYTYNYILFAFSIDKFYVYNKIVYRQHLVDDEIQATAIVELT